MRIAIIGARLAGSYSASLLSRAGHDVLLLDSTVSKEKPCGGGVTSKALRRMSWFRDNPLPHTEIKTVRMASCDGVSSDLHLQNPIHIFSRSTLDSWLRETAVSEGACFLPERAVSFTRSGKKWLIRTAVTTHEADFLVGADGATSSVRAAVAGKYAAPDLSLALGYYLPGLYHPNTVLARFQESDFTGYLWSFPRIDHSSVGILRWLPEVDAGDMRRRVLEFISAEYPDSHEKRFYAARIPCLSRRSLVQQTVCGPDWALLGDAAGFADAITAEGIYFALRSAELLAESFHRGEPREYERAWRNDFGKDLQRAAEWRDRFYGGKFLFHAFIRRAIQLTRHSATVQRLTDTIIAGNCTYDRLHRNLILNGPRVLLEIAASTLGRRTPSTATPLSSRSFES